MNKEIQLHQSYMHQQLAKTNLSSQQYDNLCSYHLARVHDFQNERLIHLLVTFFFAGLLLLSIFSLCFTPLPELHWPLSLLVVILGVLELAYIRHYYQLENGTQRLYAITKQLYRAEND